MSNTSTALGTARIGKLLASQAIPAAIGFMMMSVNMVVDTIFVGQYIGKLAIGAVAVVFPISFLISSFGMAIGMGGGSIVARALGAKDNHKAQLSFNNQITLTAIFIVIFLVLGFTFKDPIIRLFGGQGDLIPLSQTYYQIVLYGIPFLAFAMMANNNLRAEGRAKTAMLAMLVPSVVNIVLDYLFIVKLNWGMEGAGWATTGSYLGIGIFLILFFVSGRSELKVRINLMRLQQKIVKEIAAIGMVTLIRQGSISLLTILLNNSLFYYGSRSMIGGENAVGIYGIVNRIAMFAFFPLIGIAQGLVPIVGYNYGAKQNNRVKEVVKIANRWGLLIAAILCSILLMGSEFIPQIFIPAEEVIMLQETPKAIFLVFLTTPFVVFQLVGASYYQALGKAIPAMLLTLTRHFFFLIPFVFLLPMFFGLDGIWYAFIVANILSGLVCFYFLRKGIKQI